MLLSNPARNDPRVQKEAGALARAGYRVTIVAWDRLCDCEPSEDVNGYRVLRIRVKSGYGHALSQIPAFLVFCIRAMFLIRKLRPAVLHCHDLETLPAGILLSKLLECHLVFDAHEPSYFADARRFRRIVTGIAGWMERRLARAADAVLVTNEYQATKYARMKVAMVRLVPNYPEEAFSRRTEPHTGAKGAAAGDRPRSRDPGSVTVGRIGAVYHDMGLEELLAAYSALLKEFPGLKLLLVGRSTDGYADALTKTAVDVGGDVQISGEYDYDEIPAYYDRLDICVLPQKKTKWLEYITPTKFFEALCFGKPIVTTDIGGIGKIVREEGCGTVLDEVTPNAIADALRPLLKDAGLRTAMGRRGALSTISRYNWNHSIDVLLESYADVMRKSDRREPDRLLPTAGITKGDCRHG